MPADSSVFTSTAQNEAHFRSVGGEQQQQEQQQYCTIPKLVENVVGTDDDEYTTIMSFASRDVHSPKLFVNARFPTSRTTFFYTEQNCQHEFVEELVQMRSKDEPESLVRVCQLCKLKEIKH